jgi:hypothetical protein
MQVRIEDENWVTSMDFPTWLSPLPRYLSNLTLSHRFSISSPVLLSQEPIGLKIPLVRFPESPRTRFSSTSLKGSHSSRHGPFFVLFLALLRLNNVSHILHIQLSPSYASAMSCLSCRSPKCANGPSAVVPSTSHPSGIVPTGLCFCSPSQPTGARKHYLLWSLELFRTRLSFDKALFLGCSAMVASGLWYVLLMYFVSRELNPTRLRNNPACVCPNVLAMETVENDNASREQGQVAFMNKPASPLHLNFTLYHGPTNGVARLNFWRPIRHKKARKHHSSGARRHPGQHFRPIYHNPHGSAASALGRLAFSALVRVLNIILIQLTYLTRLRDLEFY